MNDILPDGNLLAELEPVERLTSGFRERQIQMDSGDVMTALLIFSGIAVALWILSRIQYYHTSQASYHSPLMLLLSLCKAHRLAWSQRWLLWRVARQQGLQDPARLFVEPERLDPANVGPVLRLRASQLEAIRRRVFGEVPDEEAVPAGTAGREAGSHPAAPDAFPFPLFPTPASPALDVPPWPPSGPAPGEFPTSRSS